MYTGIIKGQRHITTSYERGQQSIKKIFSIGDIDKDGQKDVAVVFKKQTESKTYRILYGTDEGKYITKTEGLGKDELPLDYAKLEKIAIEQAKKIDPPTTQEDIKKTIVDKIMEEKYEKK